MDFRITRKDLARKPFRGIYSEIARERGVTPQAIMSAVWNRKNLEVRGMVLEKIQERLRRDELRREAEARFERVVSPM